MLLLLNVVVSRPMRTGEQGRRSTAWNSLPDTIAQRLKERKSFKTDIRHISFQKECL